MLSKKTLLWTFSFVMILAGCKKWDEHTKLADQQLGKNLLLEISQRSNLSKFYEYLQKTGLDKELSSSKSFTVWAPVNDAMLNLDPAVVADTARLAQFLRNHISLQTYFTSNAKPVIRVGMLNGKHNDFSGSKIGEANITEKDRYVANGVLHIIDKALPVLPNAWELLEASRTAFRQNEFILSLTRKVFDPTNAIIDSISTQTGQPIYRPGTDSIQRNSFNYEVYDLQNETKQYTYFILNDASFAAETAKLAPYFKTSTADSTESLASFAVARDLIVEGLYTIDQLPAVLTSRFGVNIPIDKSKITETRKMSNGIAYVISGISFVAKEKIPVVVVQGENYLGFFDNTGLPVSPRQNNVSAVYIRSRVNPITGMPFTDMFAYNHGYNALSALYRAVNLSSVKYKVYWVAVNDTLIVDRGNRINPVTFNQRLAMGARATNYLPVTPAAGMAVTPNNYNEVYLGDYTKATFGNLFMYLTANASTGAGTNSLNLDYIKLVPDL